MKLIKITLVAAALVAAAGVSAQSRHAKTSAHPSYEGLVMAGYQGWFHNPQKGTMYPDEKNISER